MIYLFDIILKLVINLFKFTHQTNPFIKFRILFL
jgi:hypothetical protein